MRTSSTLRIRTRHLSAWPSRSRSQVARPPHSLPTPTPCYAFAWPPPTPHLGPATAGRGVRIFKVNGQMYYNYAPTLQHVQNAATDPRPVYAQLYNLDKDVASRYRFEALLAMRKKPNDNAYAVGVCLGPLHSSSHTPVKLFRTKTTALRRKTTTNLPPRRTFGRVARTRCSTYAVPPCTARGLQGSSRTPASTPSMRQAASCAYMTCALPPPGVVALTLPPLTLMSPCHSTGTQPFASRLQPCASRLQPYAPGCSCCSSPSLTLLLPLHRIANPLTVTTVHRETSISRGAARGKGHIQTSAEGQ